MQASNSRDFTEKVLSFSLLKSYKETGSKEPVLKYCTEVNAIDIFVKNVCHSSVLKTQKSINLLRSITNYTSRQVSMALMSLFVW